MFFYFQSSYCPFSRRLEQKAILQSYLESNHPLVTQLNLFTRNLPTPWMHMFFVFLIASDFKQPGRQRQRKRRLKIYVRVTCSTLWLLQFVQLVQYGQTILEKNWY